MLELAAGGDQRGRFHPKVPGDRDKVRLMRLEEAQQSSQQDRIVRSLSQIGRIDAAEGEKPLGEPLIGEAGSERAQPEQGRVVWRGACHGIE